VKSTNCVPLACPVVGDKPQRKTIVFGPRNPCYHAIYAFMTCEPQFFKTFYILGLNYLLKNIIFVLKFYMKFVFHPEF
jgi:hypothetical protein